MNPDKQTPRNSAPARARTPHLSITTKLVAYLLLASVVPLLAFGLSALHIARTIVIDQASEYSVRLASHAATYFTLYRQQVEDLAASIAGNEAIADALDASEQQTAGSYEMLNTRAQIGYILNSFVRVKGLVSIDLFTPGGKHFYIGRTLNASDTQAEVVSRMLADTELARASSYWRGVEDNVNRYSPQAKVVTLTRTIRHFDAGRATNTTVGLLLINLDDEAFRDYSPRELEQNDVRMMAVDRNGVLMYHWNHALIGERLSPEMLERVRSTAVSQQFRLDGDDVIVTSTALAGLDGQLVFVTPIRLQTAHVNRLVTTGGALLLGCLAAIALLARHYVKTVVSPLRAISRRFLYLHENPQIAHESLPMPRTNDEIATLVKGFNAHVGALAVQRTATERLARAERSAQESAARFRAIVEATPAPLAISDDRDNISYLNQRFVSTTGYTQDDIPTLADWWQRAQPDDATRQRILDSWNRGVHDDSPGEACEAELRCKDGTQRTFVISTTPLKDDAPGTRLMILFDITERKAAEQAINNLAFYDSLTGLPNRRLLLERLRQALAASRRSGRHGAVLYIDLDNFKTLNDTLGHEVGDLLLRQVALRLTHGVRLADTVARLGGDEFVVMVEDLGDSVEDSADQARVVGDKIIALLGQPYRLPAGNEYHSTPSIGIALFDDASDTVDDLLRHADLAMYQAKTAGRNTLRFFDPQMQAAIMARAALETGLRTALAEAQFVLHYQAQLDSDGTLTGVEALVRWQHPQSGLVAPGQFIALAEETGLIVQLGEWVLKSACAQLARWASDGRMARATLAVNVSARQIRAPDFVDQVVAALDATGADPRLLKLELTESQLVDNIESVIATMDRLKAHGVGFSLDDFGTGYSSLSYLKRLPLDQLKIDQSFVRDILTDPNDAAIARMIVVLADTLNITVVAEGVEREEQRDALAMLGCHVYQGYFFNRPLPIDAFSDYVRGLPAPAQG